MSNYQRNTRMVACIFAVLIIGTVSVGLLTYYGTNTFNWAINPGTTDFHFESEVGTVNETVTLDLDISAGAISVVFIDDESLLYNIDIEVQNSTLKTEGDPTVSFASNTISLSYPASGVNVTLGSAINYIFNIHTTSGGISIVLGNGAHVGDITAVTLTGGISLTMTDAAILFGNSTFDIKATTGGISIVVDLPTALGGSFEGASTTGGVSITAPGWTQVTSGYYETSNYNTANQLLTIIAETSTGGIVAVLT
ncbi:hypothetical protein EU527_06435 [Candidatus Thorarchaeota archaeon]|nr:MAG: hypothetical protein EU527_06435 [Candidatus Thorarchaeota archaeon]